MSPRLLFGSVSLSSSYSNVTHSLLDTLCVSSSVFETVNNCGKGLLGSEALGVPRGGAQGRLALAGVRL